MSLSDFVSKHTIHGAICLGAGVALSVYGFASYGAILLGAGVSFLAYGSASPQPAKT